MHPDEAQKLSFEEKYRNLFENATDGIAYIDRLGIITDVNKKAVEIFGGTRKELVGKHFTKVGVLNLREIPRYVKIFSDVIKGKKDKLIINLKNRKGRLTYLECSISSLKEGNKTTGIIIIMRDVTQRMGMEQELIESEQKYKLIFEEASDGILVADAKTKKFIFVNPKICELTGYTLKELLKLNVDNIHPKKDLPYVLPYVLDQFRKQIEGKIGIAKDMPILRKDKKIVFCDINSKNIDIKGRKCIIGFFRDISDRKKAEQIIKESEEKYNAFFNNASDAITVVSPDARKFVEVNNSAEKLTGYSKKELLSMTFDLIHPKDKIEEIMASIRKTLETGGITVLETEVLTKDNKKVPVILSGSSIKVGNKMFLMGIFKNITERKKAEEDIKTSEARYRSYIEATKQLGWTTDAKGLIIEDIPTWRAYTGQSFEKIKNWGWIKAIHPDDAKHTAEVWEKAVKTKSIYETEYRIRGKDGKYKWFLARGIPVFKEDGSIREWVGTCIDISERIKIEEEIKKARDELQSKVEEMTDASNALLNMTEDLDEANKKLLKTQGQLKKSFNELKELDVDKDRFISIAAHELKTPMTAIHGFAQLLENKKVIENDEIRSKYLKIIETEIKRLSKMVTEVLDLSRIDLGTMKFTIEDVDVAKLMEEVRDEMKEKAKEKGLKLGFNVGSELTILRTDREKLKEVLINLVDDAIKYTEKGGITFEACKEDKNIIFSVADTGIGISKKYFNKLFTRFYQVASPLTRKVGGTGLGLSISKELVESLGGKIWLKSNVGKGTTFYFTLPLKAKNKP